MSRSRTGSAALRPLRRIVGLSALGCCLILALSAPRAFAHAALLDSSPAPGGRVERSPSQISLNFTEPLNTRLSRAALTGVGGKQVSVRSRATRKQLIIRPVRALPRGAYRVRWHTVSTDDGHPLEGTYGFGVQAPAAGGNHEVEQSPLARGGWLRILLRGVFYAGLFFFAGGVLVTALIGHGRRLGAWLLPTELYSPVRAAGKQPEALARRIEARTVDAGMLALAASVAVALGEAADAGSGFSLNSVSAFLLTNTAGLARVATVLLLAVAVVTARRLRGVAVAACALVFLSIASGGHANSAEQRLAAISSDWVHLVAGALWLGGVAQIGVTWLGPLRRTVGAVRLAVMREVLEPFGRVALPAFLAVASTGLVNALIQLGHPSALWGSAYGRLLAVKIGLVGLIALASYFHALRLRPQLLAANPHPPEARERRHWRLLGAEPLLAVGVVFAAAALVAFPLPPRQLEETDAAARAGSSPVCDPCPLPNPRPNQLAVAEHAGSSVVAAWLSHRRGSLIGEIRVMGLNQRPVRAKPRVPGASLASCGPGCWRFRLHARPATLAVGLTEKGRLYTAHLPARWDQTASMEARRLLFRAQAEMRGLRSVRFDETLTSGPGSFVATRYQLQGPDRFAYRTSGDVQSVVIGTRQYTRTPDSDWTSDRFGGGGPGFRTRSFFTWTNYAQMVRLLSKKRERGRRIAQVALMSPGTPIWYRLSIDLTSDRVLAVRMITGGHFMRQRYDRFDQPMRIAAPRTLGGHTSP